MTKLADKEIFISGFNEAPPDYSGGIWILKKNRITPLFRGYGVFGLTWWENRSVLLGATRSPQTPFVAFQKRSCKIFGNQYVSIPIEYINYIPARAAHGIWLWGDKLFLVAAQGDPDAVLCSNDDFARQRVGKVIISNVKFEADRILITDSMIWNPFECDHHHHYNDILVDDHYIYLSSFSICDSQKQMVYKGSVSRFRQDLSFDGLVTDELDCPHSLQIFDGRLYVCSSRTSSIHSISLINESGQFTAPHFLDTKAHNTQIKLEYKGINAFIRGMHVTADYFFIGLSKSSGRTNSSHLTDSSNGLLKFNRKSGETIKIDMKDSCDNTYSLLMG